jgi:hypothetical protein
MQEAVATHISFSTRQRCTSRVEKETTAVYLSVPQTLPLGKSMRNYRFLLGNLSRQEKRVRL